MSHEQSFVSLQISRRVEASEKLRAFLTYVNEVGFDILPADRSISIEQPSDDIDLRRTLSRGVARHIVYDAEDLKLLLLDKRGPKDMFNPLSRAYAHLVPQTSSRSLRKKQNSVADNVERPQWRKDIARAAAARGVSVERLHAVFSSIVFPANPDYGKKGIEVSLALKAGLATTMQIRDETLICFDALAGINRSLAYPTGKIMVDLPFARLPATAEPEQILQFCERVEERLPLDLFFSNPEPEI